MIEHGDLLWKDNLTYCLCRQVRWWKHIHLWPMILHNQKIFWKGIRNEWKGHHNKIVTEEFSQFTDSVACREYTLPRDEKTTGPKGWIRGNTKIGPVLEVATRYLQGNYGGEIRIESMNKDNSHSWVRISHGLTKLVTNLNNKEQDDNEQETSEMQFEDCVKIECSCLCKPNKGPNSSTKTFPILERTWTDCEPQDYSLTDYSVSKKLINLLRHGNLPRDNDGSIEFWRLQDHLQNHFVHFRHWSFEKWKRIMARGGGNKKRFQCCTVHQD